MIFDILSSIIIFVLFVFNFIGYLIIKRQDRDLKSRENLIKLAKIRMDNQDQIIDLMAEDLKTDYHSKEWVINYYIEKINNT